MKVTVNVSDELIEDQLITARGAGQGMRVFHGTPDPESVLQGVRMDVPRLRDPGDFGWGFYCTADHRRASKYGEVLVVDVDVHQFAHIPNPYFLKGLTEVEPRSEVEKLFHSIAFVDGAMRNVQAGYDRERVAKEIRTTFIEAGYDGIIAEEHGELVVFNPCVIKAVHRVKCDGSGIKILAKHKLDLKRAVKICLETRPHVLNENHMDAETADVFVQLAAFGEVRYG